MNGNNNNPLEDLLGAIARVAEKETPKLGSLTLEQLIAMANEPRDYQVGENVEWKCAQMKTLRSPRKGQNMRVVRVLSQPIYDNKEGCGVAYFAMPLDVIVATLDTDGEYMEFAVDGRRIRRAN